MAGMDEGTVRLFTEEMGKLRNAVFGALSYTRIALEKKIDESANQRRNQFEILQKDGCFRGQLQQVQIEGYEQRIQAVEDHLFNNNSVGFPESSDSKKKFSIGFGRFKTNINGFRANDVVLILLVLIIGWVVYSQQQVNNRLNCDEQKLKQQVTSAVQNQNRGG